MSGTKHTPACAGRNVVPAHGKHTPGPWRVHKRQDEILPTLVLGGEFGDDNIADCSSWQTGRGIDEAVANAHLIAAAPELLEACRQASDMIAIMLDECGRVHGPALEVMNALDAAIAKAEGRTNA